MLSIVRTECGILPTITTLQKIAAGCGVALMVRMVTWNEFVTFVGATLVVPATHTPSWEEEFTPANVSTPTPEPPR